MPKLAAVGLHGNIHMMGCQIPELWVLRGHRSPLAPALLSHRHHSSQFSGAPTRSSSTDADVSPHGYENQGLGGTLVWISDEPVDIDEQRTAAPYRRSVQLRPRSVP